MDCKTCEEKRKQAEPVPRAVHEADMARQERSNKRLWIALLIVIALCFISNGFWIWRETQYVDEEVTQEVDTGDGYAIVSGIGDIYYGEGQADG